MSEKKLVVTEAMLNAAVEQWRRQTLEVDCVNRVRAILESALQWSSECRITPTHEQIDIIQKVCNLTHLSHGTIKHICREWQSQMFLVPRPLEERITVEEWVYNPNLWIVLRDGYNASNIPGFKDKKDAEIYRLGLIQKLKEEKE